MIVSVASAPECHTYSAHLGIAGRLGSRDIRTADMGKRLYQLMWYLESSHWADSADGRISHTRGPTGTCSECFFNVYPSEYGPPYTI